MSKVLFIFVVIITSGVGGYDFLQNNPDEAGKVVQEVVDKYDQGLLGISNAACVTQLKLFLHNLINSTDDDMWALRMIDASFKIPAGLLRINLAWLGSYDECLEIDSPLTKVKGKYCLTTIALSSDSLLGSPALDQTSDLQKSSYNWLQRQSAPETDNEMPVAPSVALCIPDQCTEEDLYKVISTVASSIPWSVTCQTKATIHPGLGDSVGAILTVSFFAIVTSLMIMSTIYDVVTQYKNGKPHPLLTSYSVYSNGQKLFSISKNSGEFSCLNGIRVISMMWVICYHIFFSQIYAPVDNFVDVVKFLLDGKKSAIIENATFSVDSFLVVTGMLVVYNFLKAKHRGHKFNLFEFYRHRYLRLTPPLIPLMLFCMFMTNYVAHGPYYPELEFALVRPCRRSWWATLLHIQNYAVGLPDFCITQSWYLNVDWQLYLVAPVFLLFMKKFPKLVISFLCFVIIGSMTASYIITWDKKLSTTNFIGDILGYNNFYYFKTHTRLSPWVIGAILGYVMATIKLHGDTTLPKLNRIFVVSTWVIALASMVACVFGGYKTLATTHYHKFSSAFYNAFARPAWAVCISWMIFSCSLGYGGIINKILSWPGFQFINKLSYSMYLIHLTLLYVILYANKHPGHFALLNMAYSYWSIFCVSFVLAIYWVLAFEVPTLQLEKYIFESKKPKPKKVENGAATESAEEPKV